jgi:Icc protein
MSMRLVQITDCHVSGAPDALYRGQHPRHNLDALLETVRAWAPGLVLATGDLSEDAHPDSYTWLAGRLYSLGAPVMAAPGNHDEAARLAHHFAAAATDAPLVFNDAGWQLVLLNSAVPGEISGRFDAAMLAGLDEALGQNSLPKLVALHHQPLPVGSPWIDRYPLLDPEGFWGVLKRHRAVRIVSWGHIHHAVEFDVGNIRALGGPSTACNSLPGKPRFDLDPAGPASRWFELREDGSFDTGLMYTAAST